MANIFSTNSKRNDKKIILVSFLVAFFLNVKTINAYITKGSEEGGYMSILYILVIGAIGLTCLWKKQQKRVPYNAFLIPCILSLFYSLTCVFSGNPRVNIAYFSVFTISSFLIPFLVEINVRQTLKIMMILSSPAILFLNQIFAFKIFYDERISMGICYVFLTPIVASIVYMFLYFKNENFVSKIISLILFLINMVYFMYLFLFGSRGPLLEIFALFLILYFLSISNKGFGIKVNKKRFKISIVIVFIILGIGFTIFDWLNNLFASYGINVYFIDKMLELNDAGDVSNGRNELYDLAIADFLQSPLFGRGIGRFDANHPGGSYPHNFVLQILSDGGLLLFFLLFIPIIKQIKNFIKYCTFDKYAILITLFFASVPGALFSGDLWESGNLWFLFGAIMSNRLIQKNYE